MSSFIYENNKFLTFNEYCLCEAIKPKKISFGLNDDTDDGKTSYNGLLITFFKLKGFSYSVMVVRDPQDDYQVGFATSKVKENLLDNFTTFSTRRMGGGHAAEIFSNVFYILLQMLKKHNIKKIKFNGADAILGRLYTKLMKNKFFIAELENAGYKFDGEKEERFHFSKK